MTEGGAVIGPCGWRSMDLLPGCPQMNDKEFNTGVWTNIHIVASLVYLVIHILIFAALV